MTIEQEVAELTDQVTELAGGIEQLNDTTSNLLASINIARGALDAAVTDSGLNADRAETALGQMTDDANRAEAAANAADADAQTASQAATTATGAVSAIGTHAFNAQQAATTAVNAIEDIAGYAQTATGAAQASAQSAATASQKATEAANIVSGIAGDVAASAANASAASDSALVAAGHVATASNKADIATGKATQAATSATAAADSATSAATSATAAAGSATSAGQDASSATGSKNAAAASATAAEQSKNDAASSATAAAGSATSASGSATAASNHAATATSKASEADASADAAAISAQQAQDALDTVLDGQLNANWAETDPASKAFIQNKPDLSALTPTYAAVTSALAPVMQFVEATGENVIGVRVIASQPGLFNGPTIEPTTGEHSSINYNSFGGGVHKFRRAGELVAQIGSNSAGTTDVHALVSGGLAGVTFGASSATKAYGFISLAPWGSSGVSVGSTSSNVARFHVQGTNFMRTPSNSSSIDLTTDTINFAAAHNFTTGDCVTLRRVSGTMVVGGISAFNRAYFVNVASTTSITLHPSFISSLDGTSKLDISSGTSCAVCSASLPERLSANSSGVVSLETLMTRHTAANVDTSVSLRQQYTYDGLVGPSVEYNPSGNAGGINFSTSSLNSYIQFTVSNTTSPTMRIVKNPYDVYGNHLEVCGGQAATGPSLSVSDTNGSSGITISLRSRNGGAIVLSSDTSGSSASAGGLAIYPGSAPSVRATSRWVSPNADDGNVLIENIAINSSTGNHGFTHSAIGTGTHLFKCATATVLSVAPNEMTLAINEQSTSKTVDATAGLTTITVTKRRHILTGPTAGGTTTIVLPAAAAALDGRIHTVLSTIARPSTTWTSSGATVVGAVSSLVGNVPYSFVYDHASLTWYPTH